MVIFVGGTARGESGGEEVRSIAGRSSGLVGGDEVGGEDGASSIVREQAPTFV